MLGALALLVLAAVVLLARGSSEDGARVVMKGPGFDFNLRYPGAMQRVEPAGDELLRLEREGLDAFVVEPLELPPYRGDVSGVLPVVASRELDALKQRFPGLELVEEGKTRINQVRGLLARLPGEPQAAALWPARAAARAGARRAHGRQAPAAGQPRRGRGHGARRRHPRPAQDPVPELPLRHRGPMTIEFDQFLEVDMRVGRIVAVEDFPEARKPAWKLTIDFGAEIGMKRSSAQITNYTREQLEGRLVVAVVNFPPRQIGPLCAPRCYARRLGRGGPHDPARAGHGRPARRADPLSRAEASARRRCLGRRRAGDRSRSGAGVAVGAGGGTGVAVCSGVAVGAGGAGVWAGVGSAAAGTGADGAARRGRRRVAAAAGLRGAERVGRQCGRVAVVALDGRGRLEVGVGVEAGVGVGVAFSWRPRACARSPWSA